MPGSLDHRRRALVFWTATGLIAVDTVLFTMVVPALPEFADRYGFSTTVAALIFAAFPVGQLITALGSVGFVERAGRRPAMIIAAVLLAAATLAFALSVGVATLALARLVQGLAAGLVWTAGLAAISDITPVDQLGFRMGLAETAGGGIGLIGPLVGGALIDTVGTDAAFALGAILPAIAVIPALAMPETRRHSSAELPRLAPALRRLAGGPQGARRLLVARLRWPPCSRWWSRCCRSTWPTASTCRRSASGWCSPPGSWRTSPWCPWPGGCPTSAAAARPCWWAAPSWRPACR